MNIKWIPNEPGYDTAPLDALVNAMIIEVGEALETTQNMVGIMWVFFTKDGRRGLISVKPGSINELSAPIAEARASFAAHDAVRYVVICGSLIGEHAFRTIINSKLGDDDLNLAREIVLVHAEDTSGSTDTAVCPITLADGRRLLGKKMMTCDDRDWAGPFCGLLPPPAIASTH